MSDFYQIGWARGIDDGHPLEQDWRCWLAGVPNHPCPPGLHTTRTALCNDWDIPGGLGQDDEAVRDRAVVVLGKERADQLIDHLAGIPGFQKEFLLVTRGLPADDEDEEN